MMPPRRGLSTCQVNVLTKILVLSDTHGNYPAAFRALEAVGKVDHIIHLGDGVDDAALLERTLERPVIMLPGNCDSSPIPYELTLELEGVRIFLCHGHRYNVKGGTDRLAERARHEGATAVLFGHTHRALIECREGLLIVNPGPLEKGSASPTCALLTLSEGEASSEIVAVPPPLPQRV